MLLRIQAFMTGLETGAAASRLTDCFSPLESIFQIDYNVYVSFFDVVTYEITPFLPFGYTNFAFAYSKYRFD